MEGLSTSISSAIHSAPPEIIIAILENLVASSQNLPLGRRYRYVIRFTHVSSRLRNIAITTPTLWTRIEITDSPATFELAKVCLQRSGEQRLDINISVMSRIGIKLPGILALINYAATRTERLSLTLALKRGHAWSETQKALQALVLPYVGDLELALWDEELWRELPSTSLPAQVPQLRSLVLRDVLPPVQPTLLSNLKKLVITSSIQSSWPLGRLQEVLKECQQLEILELIAKPENRDIAVTHTVPTEPTRQSLPNLMRLTLKGQSSKFCFQLLQDLDAPELEEVEFGFVVDRSDEPVEWTSTYNPFNSVRLLTVSVLPCPSHIRLQAFLPGAFPNVEELALFMHGWPLLDTFSPVPKGESDGSRSTPCWNELRGLSVADNDGGKRGCDGRCMKRLQAVKTFLEARSSRSLPRLKWAQVRSCGSVAFHAEFDATAEAIKGMLEEDEGLGFSLLEKEKTRAVNGTFGGD